jgi:AraC-like DNA-binding protein
MPRIVPLWRSDAISVHRFDHPAEHEDRPYEEVSTAFVASFVEAGAFDLAVAGRDWRVQAGDVMLQRPGMRFRASYEGAGFTDTCLTIVYLTAQEDGFDLGKSWERANRAVLPRSGRLNYLRWSLSRAIDDRQPMLAEHCATEIFREIPEERPASRLSARRFDWYAERVRFACARIEEDFAADLTSSMLARECGMSLFHFSRIFAELTGTPPHQRLLRTRLEAAAKMLREGRSVTETCFAVGFGDVSHFTRSFARWHGAPPSALRRQI